MTAGIRSRIAPTPSGYLHLGNAFNFLLTESLTKQFGGLLRLRIDDLDAQRARAEYLEDIFESLRWLGIATDEGPRSNFEHNLHFGQFRRIYLYNSFLEQVAGSGRVFVCTCSRAEVLRDGQYSGKCRYRGLPLTTRAAAWRFRTDENDVVTWNDGFLGRQMVSLYHQAKDFIIRRRDGLPGYHIASLYDDVDYGVNLVVRGRDLLPSTAAQLLIATHSGKEGFLETRFFHHPLVNNECGEKLSKSAGSYSLKAMREAGATGQSVRQQAADWFQTFS